LRVAIGLGCSLGDRRMALELAVRKLGSGEGMRFLRGSRWWMSPPLAGGAARNWFLNGVALYDCGIALDALLDRCRELESRAGRRRSRHWGDRPLDLDILVAEGLTRDDPRLVVPHPAIGARAFVVWPLLEVWPDAVDAAGRPWRDVADPRPPRPWPVGVVAARPAAAYLGTAGRARPPDVGERS
jgi:2-amino-4-hydroxy-6-hydroxymethyldihydropteridine diphosphokinase